MIKAALFDLDGTLLNRNESVIHFIKRQYERLHKEVGHIPKEKYIAKFIELDQHGYVWKDKVYQQLVNEFKIEKITWEDLLYDYVGEFKNNCVPFPYLIEMLVNLKNKNLHLGIITNGYGKFQMDNIKALGIKEYFDVILISEWEGMKKPDQRIFKKALDHLSISPQEAVFVGDHPDNDVKAARNVGLIGVWKKDDQWDRVEADFIVEDLSELTEVIEWINLFPANS
ncbi:L-2-haloalkanoic acid dehalogenase [Bacillus sp. SA1-12]|uniref:HAD family hydrolase n=1 Tax=Bacillus sp. SA1-12 TaxID=1455638 RepID=UPI00062713A7|nr:HAD family hydrolase [Bacillus sp. SA1-12]KKI90627.1 L-2-haloalkanoic acid dehalogenase [Bacillus sp. SA1-12]